ncbi:MAG: phosphoribosyl-ATP diphosphatase [Candidatus Eremiobacteraeota bacterium]|nr:phosphoribosyl-ATP diphosphatase [Candidatus Eremiobacteraeota bacterium]
MLVCSIDIMNGAAVQLRQGKEHVLTSPTPPLELAREFNRYGEVAVIDLDAALGKGDNLELLCELCRVADVRAGGGIRDLDRAKRLLRAGARQLIIGTAATPEFLAKLPAERVSVAIDHVGGKVVDHGWTASTGEDLLTRANRLAPHCGAFLCTFVEDEGGMQGLNLTEVERLGRELPHPVTFAGGVRSAQDVVGVSRLGHDVQVGMALYTGALSPASVVVDCLDWEKCPQMPTVVSDGKQVLMLAYSTPESLARALSEGKGIYFSRSRNQLWEKGLSSGHTQRLVSCRTDCDRDALLALVEQTGPACHTGRRSCFYTALRDGAEAVISEPLG